MTISRFGFLVMTFAYAAFLGLEALQPGFVATAFSPHMLLAVSLAFGAVDALRMKGTTRVGAGSYAAALGVGFVFGVLAWSYGAAFADARLFLALAVAALPVVSLLVYRKC